MNTLGQKTTPKWKHPDVPETSGVYPVKKDKVIYHVAGNQDQPPKGSLGTLREITLRAKRQVGTRGAHERYRSHQAGDRGL